RLMGDILREQEGEALTDLARRLYEYDGGDPRALMDDLPELRDADVAQRLLRAFTVLFQLLNTAQQKEIVRVNRERQARDLDAPRSESLTEAIARLKESGASAQAVQQLLDQLE